MEPKAPKIVNAGAESGLAQRFSYRKPRRMVQLTIDPKLDCYELAEPIPPFRTAEFVDVVEPQPYVDIDKLPNNIEAEFDVPKQNPELSKTPENNPIKLNANKRESWSSAFFCTAPRSKQKEIVFDSTARKLISEVFANTASCMACKPARIELLSDDCKQNECPHCHHTLPQKEVIDIGQKKRQFWQVWLSLREVTGRMPSSSFQENFRLFKEDSLEGWKQHITSIFH